MSKTKNKTHSETNHLKGRIRSQSRLIRQLKKRLKELERKSHFYEEVVDEFVEDVEVQDRCLECGKGNMIAYDFVHMILKTCDVCGHKERSKK